LDSLQQNFDELRQRLKHGRGMDHASDDPVFYLVFKPEEMLTVKRRMKQWVAKLNIEGWKVHIFSMAEVVHEILRKNDLRDIWLDSEQDAPLDFDSINETLADALTGVNTLRNKLEDRLKSLKGQEDTVLFITDLEALHPYLRVGTIEQGLQGRFTVPTVILYPGKRSGRTTLSFLGIYPEDGNYRSIHIGG
jgi:hypothetical protein